MNLPDAYRVPAVATGYQRTAANSSSQDAHFNLSLPALLQVSPFVLAKWHDASSHLKRGLPQLRRPPDIPAQRAEIPAQMADIPT